MAKLVKIGESSFQFQILQRCFEGNQEAISVCMMAYGFDTEDIETGFISLVTRGNDTAHYGVRKTFIY